MIRHRLYDKTDYAVEHETMGMDHIEHCYDALRQSVMCSADLTPIPWVWNRKDHQAKALAKIAHTCRDYDAIRDWAKEHELHEFDRFTYVPDDLNPQ